MDAKVELISNFDQEIPIVIEEEEDAMSFIERAYQEKCVQQPKQKSFCKSTEQIVTHDGGNLTNKFYLNELLISYKERISFLEREVSKKDIIINNFFKLTNNLLKDSRKTCVDDVQKVMNDHSYVENFTDSENEPVSNDENKTAKKEKQTSSIQDQLSEIRKNRHSNYLSTKELTKEKTDFPTGQEKKVIVMGDSMLNGIKEKDLDTKKTKVKVKYFGGAKVADLKRKVEMIIEEKPTAVILYAGTNDAVTKPSNAIIDELLSLKNRIENELPCCKVVISSLTPRVDDGKAALTIKNFNNHLNDLKIDILDNSNILVQDLGKRGLHLSNYGKKKLTRNILRVIYDLEN